MSEIAMLLDDQAVELGFESYEEALAKGYEVDWEAMNNGVVRLCIDREQESAHEAWLKEKAGVLADLETLREDFVAKDYQDEVDALNRAIDFIKRGEV